MSKLAQVGKWLKVEIIHAIPAFIFFIIAFNIIVLTDNLLLAPNDIHYFNHIEATLFGLVVGKVIILVNTLPFINAFPKKPLIYNISWKVLIYIVAAFLFRVVEHLIRKILYHPTITDSIQALAVQLHSPVFWVVQIWLCALFIVYVIFSEYTRVIGKDKIVKILLG